VRERAGEQGGATAYGVGIGVHSQESYSTVYRTLNHVAIDTADYRYKLIEVTKPKFLNRGPGLLILTVGGLVRFAKDGDSFVILDDKNQQHRFAVEGIVALEVAGGAAQPQPDAQRMKRLEDRLLDPDFGYRQYRSQLQSWQVIKEVDSTMAALRSEHSDLDEMLPFMRIIMESIRPNWAAKIELGEYLEGLYAISKSAGFAVATREILAEREKADTGAKGAQAESLSSPPNAELTGTYSGVVRNLAVGLSADFTISVSESKGGAIQGCMAVKLPLAGSGYLRGAVRGSQFSFVVVGDLMEIRAEGQRDANSLSGTYLVPSPNGGSAQKGTFVLHKTSSEGPSNGFNILNCPSDAAFMREAAEQGNVSAQLNLGILYLQGHGVAQDYLQAFYWVKLAAAGGVKDAKQEDVAALLESIATHLTPATLSQVQEKVRAWLAAHPTKGG